MTAIRLLPPCQRFQFRAAAIPASLKTSVKACHRYSDCRSCFADKVSQRPFALPTSKIGNLKSKIAHAPLAQLAEQVTLNSKQRFWTVFAAFELVRTDGDRSKR